MDQRFLRAERRENEELLFNVCSTYVKNYGRGLGTGNDNGFSAVYFMIVNNHIVTNGPSDK